MSDAPGPSGRGGGGQEYTRGGVRKNKFVPTMPSRRKKAEEPHLDASTTVGSEFEALIRGAQSDEPRGGGRGRGRERAQLRMQTVFSGAEEARPSMGSSMGGGGGSGGGGGGGGGGGSGGGGGRGSGGGSGGAASSQAGKATSGPSSKGGSSSTTGRGAAGSAPALKHEHEPFADWGPPPSAPKREKQKPRGSLLNYNQLFPTLLPLHESFEDAMEDEGADTRAKPIPPDLATTAEPAENTASALGLHGPALRDSDQVFLFQLPAMLPVQSQQAARVKEEPGRRPSSAGSRPGSAGASGPSTRPSSALSNGLETPAAEQPPRGASLRELPSGRLGRLLVFESGKVKLQVGDVLLDVASGLPCIGRQDLVGLNHESGHAVLLGSVSQRAVVSPDVWQLMDDAPVPQWEAPPGSTVAIKAEADGDVATAENGHQQHAMDEDDDDDSMEVEERPAPPPLAKPPPHKPPLPAAPRPSIVPSGSTAAAAVSAGPSGGAAGAAPQRAARPGGLGPLPPRLGGLSTSGFVLPSNPAPRSGTAFKPVVKRAGGVAAGARTGAAIKKEDSMEQ